MKILTKRHFNIYGINVKEHFESSYKETDYEHYSNMSSIFDNAGNDSLALQYKEKEVEAAKYIHGVKSMEYFNSLLGACFMYEKYKFYEEAINGMNHLKDIHAEVWGEEDKYNYAMLVRTLAQFYSHASDNEMSIKTYKESIDLFKLIHAIDNEYALTLRFLASEYDDIGDNESSLYYQQKAIEVRRNIGDSDKYVNELYNAVLTLEQGNIKMVEEELVSMPDFVDNTSVAFVDIFKSIAFSYELQENLNRAMLYCDKALSILKEKGWDNTEKYAEVLGLKCRYQGHANLRNEAISTGKEGKHIYETLHVKSTNYADLLNDLAMSYIVLEDYEQAIQMLEVACSIYEDTSDWLSLAECLNNIGDCYQNKYDFDQAELYVQKSLSILSNNVSAEQYVTDAMNEMKRIELLSITQDRIERSKADHHSRLAMIYSKKGEIKRAIEEEKKAGKILQVMPNDQDFYNLHLIGLATLYRENEEFEEAIRCEEQSLKFWENLGQKDYIIATQYNLAITYFAKGDTIRAIEHIKNGILTSRSNDNKWLAEGMGLLAVLYWKSSRYEEAKVCLSESLDLIEEMLYQKIGDMTSEQKQRVWNHFRNLFFTYRDLIYENGGNGEDVARLYNYPKIRNYHPIHD
ncbi:MAG: tetratricopeptide repeat protein [Bacteroidaceae bacterium]|nr:tetratricopeptide repeat protein [Bacteroidaceae bacterium]